MDTGQIKVKKTTQSEKPLADFQMKRNLCSTDCDHCGREGKKTFPPPPLPEGKKFSPRGNWLLEKANPLFPHGGGDDGAVDEETKIKTAKFFW